jgi:L-serine dehydratase
MSDRSSIFDMIGPVMIGPSSSHTAGVVRIGHVARRIFGELPEEAIITFYNSFAKTYEGHGSDRAVLAGLLNMKTDDERIRTSPEEAKAAKLKYTFKAVHNASTLHPNTLRIEISGNNRKTSIVGVSKGGGIISIREVDGFATNFSAQSYTLLIKTTDTPGSVAFISSVISQDGANIATMTVNRTGKNATQKLVFEIDHPLKPTTISYIKELSWTHEVLYLPVME